MSAERQRGPARVYAGKGIEVHWEPRLCIHTRNCVRNLGTVFDPERRPWIDADAADADSVAAAVRTCPTGALHYVRTDGGEQEQPEAETSVTPVPRRHARRPLPLWVVGEQAVLRREPPADRLRRLGLAHPQVWPTAIASRTLHARFSRA